MRANFSRYVLAFCCALAASVSGAEGPRQIGWENLTLKLSAAENPFATLSPEQLEALVDVAVVRDRRARGAAVTAQETSSERNAIARLQQAGVNVDRLLAQRDEIAARQRALASAVNPALDGQQVRMAGYLLPLEFAGKEVTEFLLVPWAGACIHTPPPPANQIVHVKPEKPVAVTGMFDAVWVTGRIAASASKKAVFITDGSSELDVGYSMRATQVEPYKQP
ncbi:MAG TPA: DUF3299 domain-containing protein [Burkholderiaceae bacterium]|jgi:hypothetical protein|nr:DUF3299 domain-containing protein [Burkholderiaceae bacterium]